MRIGMVAENPVESLVLASGIVPVPLAMSFLGMGVCRTLLAGVSLGVFDALAGRELGAAEVAAATSCNPAGMATLLAALNGFGYLRKRNGRYRNSALARRWLLAGGGMRDTILFLGDMWDQLSGLEHAVRTGEMRRLHESGHPPEFWERYMRSLAAFARLAVPEINRKVKLSGPPRRLLDVGGGHGMYSVGFCKKFPTLTAEVLDLPQAAAHGRKIVAEAGFGDRVSYREGDMRTAQWGEGYDVVFLFNVIHNATEPEVREMLLKARAALRPGGTLAILESAHEKRLGDISQTGGFNELFFFLVSGAQAYPEENLQQWIAAAGFGSPGLSRLLFAPAVLLTARKAMPG